MFSCQPSHFRIRLAVVSLSATLALSTGPAHAGWLDFGRQAIEGATAPRQTGTSLPATEIGAGLKEALIVGTERVIGQLGRTDGFNADPAIHIPLPGYLETARGTLDKVGMGGSLDELELRLNRAAEAATPKAKELFLQSISEMTLDDAKTIYNGPKDAATRYFQQKMSPGLAASMRPVVDQSLSEVGAVQSYEQVMGQYRTLPFVPDVKSDLAGYVVDKGLSGIFHYLALEEAAIRQDPARRTTDLLRKVFAQP